ncbi:hypothetical protein TcWFU_010482 [Taenia crassiceps]|uniref:Uncharacterized protein n=1 Tax=Taenia crassiceps TaxID=6207 RepID=A0ABR4Q1F1_9CEST
MKVKLGGVSWAMEEVPTRRQNLPGTVLSPSGWWLLLRGQKPRQCSASYLLLSRCLSTTSIEGGMNECGGSPACRQTPLTRRAVDPTSSARHPTLMWLHCEPCERRMDVGRDQSHKVALVAEARLPCQPAYGCSCVQHIV